MFVVAFGEVGEAGILTTERQPTKEVLYAPSVLWKCRDPKRMVARDASRFEAIQYHVRAAYIGIACGSINAPEAGMS
jgi:hypothetical protein